MRFSLPSGSQNLYGSAGVAAFLLGIFWERNLDCIVIFLGFLVSLFASSIHMFPIAMRLRGAFPFPSLSYWFLCHRQDGGNFSRKAELVAVFLMFTLMLTNNGIMVYKNGGTCFQKGEANPAIAYLQEHVSEGKWYMYTIRAYQVYQV